MTILKNYSLRHISAALFLFFGILLQAAEKTEAAARFSIDAYLQAGEIKERYQKRYLVNIHEIKGLFFYTLEDSNEQIIVFRGTQNIQNWQTNLTIKEAPFDDILGAIVHAGFYKAAMNALQHIPVKKNKPILVTGHSLGGAAALLLGATLYNQGYDASVITFGMPPVGNAEFVSAFEYLSHLRFEHIFDLVPKADKKAVRALQEIVKNIEFDSSHKELNSIIDYLKSIPYSFVHHGEERMITHILPFDILSLDLLSQPVRYHEMSSYLMAFE